MKLGCLNNQKEGANSNYSLKELGQGVGLRNFLIIRSMIKISPNSSILYKINKF